MDSRLYELDGYELPKQSPSFSFMPDDLASYYQRRWQVEQNIDNMRKFKSLTKNQQMLKLIRDRIDYLTPN
jgi:hypothetical protein